MSARRPQSFSVVMVLAAALCLAKVSADDRPVDIATAQSALVRLDQLRAVGQHDSIRVREILDEGVEALSAARNTPNPPPGTRPEGVAAENDGSSAARDCQIDFLRADLHRRAAATLAGDDPPRVEHAQRALELFKALRIEYRQLAAGLLGYIGEARVHQDRGDLTRANAVLDPVAMKLDDRRLAQQPAQMLQVQRLLWLERVQIALAQDLAAGRAMADQVMQSPLMKDASPAEANALKWAQLAASAEAALGGQSANAAELAAELRDPAIEGVAPEHQRIKLLIALRERRGIDVTVGELLYWARLQAWAALPGAQDSYAKAAALASDELSAADWQSYGVVLASAGKQAQAADAFVRAAADLSDDPVARLALLQTVASIRVQQANQQPDDTAQQRAAADALWQLIESTEDRSIQRDALRSWAHLQRDALAESLQQLEPYQSIIDEDPYLQLVVSGARWNSASPADRQQLAREIASRLKSVLPSAQRELAPSIVLFMAQLAAEVGGAGEALAVIAAHESNLACDAPAMEQILALKLSWLLQSGLVTEADALVDSAGAKFNRDEVLRLARMLAERYSEFAQAPQQQAQIRQRVADLVSSVLARGGAADENARLGAARALVAVQAYVQAEQILSGGANAPEAKLLLVEALVGQQKLDDARAALNSALADDSNDGELQLAAGRLELQLGQWPAAAEAFREARKHLDVGGAKWWDASIGLARALVAQGQPDAARDIIRVANALYREGAPATMLNEIDAIVHGRGEIATTQKAQNG